MSELQRLERLNQQVLNGEARFIELKNYLLKRYSYNAANRMLARMMNGSSLKDTIYAESEYYRNYKNMR